MSDIKALFGLKKKLGTYVYESKSGELKTSYRLHLGADLFNEMLDNYNLSLPRKRVKFIDTKLARKLMIPTPLSGPVKFKFSKEDLEALIQTVSKSKITELHEKRFRIPISRSLVFFWCKKWGIKSPLRG